MQCHAKSKRSGKQCKNHAVKRKKVCRMHGAFAGVKTVEGRKRQIEAVTKHGHYSRGAIEDRCEFAQLMREHREALAQVPC